MWLLSTWNIASATKDLDFYILFSLNDFKNLKTEVLKNIQKYIEMIFLIYWVT